MDSAQVLSGTLGAFPSGTSGVRLQSSSSNTFHIDYIRYNGVSASPATGQLTLKVDYGVQLAGLTTLAARLVAKVARHNENSETVSTRGFLNLVMSTTGSHTGAP